MNISSLIRSEVQKALRVTSKAIRRGTIGTAASATYTSQIQGDGEETFEGTEIWQQFGLASRAPQGGEALLVEPSGSGEGAIAIATQDRAHRPSIAEGDTILYGSLSGGDQCKVHVKGNGEIDVLAFSDFWIRVTADDMMIQVDSGELEFKASSGVFVGKADMTTIGTVATAQPMILGTAFNTAIGLVLTPWISMLTALQAAIGSTSNNTGISYAFNLLAVSPAFVPGSPETVACAAAFAACDVVYPLIGATISAVTAFQGALTGLLTTQLKAS